MEELRSVIVHLRPAALESQGLAEALATHVEVLRRVHAREIALAVEGDAPVAAAIEGDVFRIAQEALHNALRHAGASHIAVTLCCDPGRLQLVVHDDGIGFEPTAPGLRSRSLGLTTMAERARAAGGTLTIESAAGAGTTVRLAVGAGAVAS
jgi:signal transduction histidine kinase